MLTLPLFPSFTLSLVSESSTLATPSRNFCFCCRFLSVLFRFCRWQPWYVNGQTAGYWEQFASPTYTFATIKVTRKEMCFFVEISRFRVPDMKLLSISLWVRSTCSNDSSRRSRWTILRRLARNTLETFVGKRRKDACCERCCADMDTNKERRKLKMKKEEQEETQIRRW